MLHVPTLAMVAVFVTTILGALLWLVWRRDQNSNALLWWGTSYLLGALTFPYGFSCCTADLAHRNAGARSGG